MRSQGMRLVFVLAITAGLLPAWGVAPAAAATTSTPRSAAVGTAPKGQAQARRPHDLLDRGVRR